MTAPLHDPDMDLGRLRDGYPALAKWIAQDPDDDPLVFRKFGRLSARSILNKQCKLVALEEELDDLDEEARTSELDTKRSLQRWETLMDNAKTVDSVEDRLVKKLDEFESFLKEYYKLLTLRSQIAQLNKPTDRVLAAYNDFLQGTSFSDKTKPPMSLIYGRASTFLQEKADLVALQRPSEEDHLSRFLQNHWLFQKRNTHDPLDRTTIYKNSHIQRTISALNLILAALLLIGATVTLYLVSSPKAKLGLVAMYTLLFASSMVLCTNARRAEIFAATAAYAAVLVVFVSGNLGGNKSEQCLIQLESGIWKTLACPN